MEGKINIFFVKWQGKAVELTKAPLDALLQTEIMLKNKTLTETPFYYAVQDEIKKRQEVPKA